MTYIQFHAEYDDWFESINMIPVVGHSYSARLSGWEPIPEVVYACRGVVYHPRPKKSLEDWM